ncbi:hypothetical protein EJ08DRAFT_682287 [Tothia fuscella]|uniref:Bacteriophage T5 Orf172 DNA-binding domain-containing protein n=1 Tax=Tothia fuscella TaxID=1048955 RepID=A0A9P4NIU8_9PEZI|nr:hypothetical protein EJ08DRAFT_682287 [Tothia fuscella]
MSSEQHWPLGPIPESFGYPILATYASSQQVNSIASDGEPFSLINDDIILSPTAQRLIDDCLKKKITSRLTKKQYRAKNPGYVYILEDPQRPGLYKIGMSKAVGIRTLQIEKDCGLALNILNLDNPPMLAEKRAELLCQKELRAFNVPVACRKCTRPDGTPKIHKEWFRIEYNLVEKVVHKWTEFLIQRPYDKEGELKTFWRERLNIQDLDLGREDVSKSVGECAVMRHEMWHRFVSTWWLDKIRHQWTSTLERFRRFEFWAQWMWVLFVLVVLLLFIEVYSGFHIPRSIHFSVQMAHLVPYIFIKPEE